MASGPVVRALFTVLLFCVIATAQDKPNIIYIMADDLGYGELGCYGQQKIETPNIDRLAKQGMRFTHHYAGAPVCAPTRCVLMTGLHTGHAHVRGNKGKPVVGQLPLPPGTVTLAHLLKQQGYKTCAVGKWGLGGPATKSQPNDMGFDHWFGYLDQWNAHSHYPKYLYRNRQKVALDGKTYSQVLFQKEVQDWIAKQKKGEPFFLYYAPTIPHVSLHVPAWSLERYKGLWKETPYKGGHYSGHETPRAAYAAMITHLDGDIGRLMAELKQAGLDKNTLVIFTSDNGPTYAGGVDHEFFDSNGPLRGLKGSLYEGGIRVPMIARWPGRIKADSVNPYVSAMWDVLPTLVELAGGQPPEETDGISFLPELFGKRQWRQPQLYWEHNKVQALRKGHLKAIRPLGKPMQIYNLDMDPGETRDVADALPTMVKKFAALMDESRTPSEHFPLFPPKPNWLGKDFWANRLQDWRRVGTKIECLSKKSFRTAHLVTHRIPVKGDFELTVTIGGGGVGGVLLGTDSPLVHGVTGRGAGVFVGRSTFGFPHVWDLNVIGARGLDLKPSRLRDRSKWKVVSVDSEESGQEGRLAIDGDPTTKWHSQWRKRKPGHPHEIVIDIGESTYFDGIGYLARDTGANGRINKFQIYTSEDGKDWGEPFVTDRFRNVAGLQWLEFPRSLSGRYVRLVSLSAHNKRPVAAIAELYLFFGRMPTVGAETRMKIVYKDGVLQVSRRGAIPRSIKMPSLHGGIALVSHKGRAWFRDLKITGTTREPGLGPILSAQYTLSEGTLKLTAQMMPVHGEVLLETHGRKITARIDTESYTATFRIRGCDAREASPYTLRYKGQTYSGTIRRDPTDKDELVLAALSCNHNNSHRIARQPFDWRTGMWFPHGDLASLVAKQKPDLLFFAGDQLYEGRSPSPADRSNLRLDYLYKWYLWCWAYRDLTRNTPCIVIPDDHDVFQGNVWGEGGRKTDRDSKGGYVHPASFIKLVERTQTSHLPDPVDPAPVAQGIGVYFTELAWGKVSFAILEDRKFKSGCMGRLPPTGTKRPDHINDPDFDMKKADLPGLKLLGQRQLNFLERWANTPATMKAVLSQTAFAGLATHHGANLTYLRADLDSNGWPQSGRNRALRLIRKAGAVHICGDQHLASVVQHGIDAHGDGPWGFCVPAAANFYPRKWWPKGATSPLGKHLDGFGNRVTVHAVANPVKTGKGELHDGMPGFGIVRFRKKDKQVIFECWPRHGGAQYPGWPVTVDVK